jgi:hypothetical protein
MIITLDQNILDGVMAAAQQIAAYHVDTSVKD